MDEKPKYQSKIIAASAVSIIATMSMMFGVDPGAYSSWPAATCTITVSPNNLCVGAADPYACCTAGTGQGTCEVDTGTKAGPRFYTADINSTGDWIGIEEWAHGDIP